MSVNRRVVFVSGAPGAGKTTLGRPLAEHLGFAFLSKDQIKETLHDSFQPPEGDLDWSRRLGRAAMDLLFTLAGECPAAVLESNFVPSDESVRARLAELAENPIELCCHCPPAEAARRFAARASMAHPAHVWRELPPTCWPDTTARWASVPSSPSTPRAPSTFRSW
ncbi:AAA family ATPase [Streptomyces hyaluromycini]|uniref:AAA family ATPase n=1 Tax=Streptomyces hyaluromycini TaxID=1377993 RepID=UPI001C3FA1E7|nr:AAA family ATPase [Streptomyces hyaluromycini]